MKKLYVPKKEEVVTTSEPTLFCGFVIRGKVKGYLVHIGDNLKAVLFEEYPTVPNRSCGADDKNLFENVKEFLSLGLSDCGMDAEKIYFFDSLKELHSWLIED